MAWLKWATAYNRPLSNDVFLNIYQSRPEVCNCAGSIDVSVCVFMAIISVSYLQSLEYC